MGMFYWEKDLTPEKIETLKHFSLIYARESLTATMLKQELNLKNIVTFPDPAFVLEPEKWNFLIVLI